MPIESVSQQCRRVGLYRIALRVMMLGTPGHWRISLLGFLICLLLSTSSQDSLAAIYPAYIDGTFTLGDATEDAAYGLQNTFNLDSLPSATKTIYLDFTGHHSVNNSWGHNIQFPAYDLDGDPSTFSTAELEEIQLIFQNVAEDFLPFNVNVTTENPGVPALRQLGTGDVHWGIRAVMTQATNGFGVGIGGDSGSAGFDDDADNPVFIFNKGARKGGQTATHEVAHTFGLSHDGLFALERHPGTGGFGRNSWGPVMGAPFDATLSQWSNGDYAGATNVADDYAFLTSRGFGFRPDDYLTSVDDPHVLDIVDNSIFEWGIIENRNDVDYFQFTTGFGEVSIDVSSFAKDANLDVAMTLYDSEGNVISVIDPTVTINALLDITLSAGDYVIGVDGDGMAGRYSDYGSVGFYQINIDLPIFADLNADNQLDQLDWNQFIANSEADLTGLTDLQAYQAGDLDGDGVNSVLDFGLFKDAYIEANGLAAFEALFVQVPEPASSFLAFALLTGCLARIRIHIQRQS